MSVSELRPEQKLTNPIAHKRSIDELSVLEGEGSVITNYLLMRLTLALEAVAGQMHGINVSLQTISETMEGPPPKLPEEEETRG